MTSAHRPADIRVDALMTLIAPDGTGVPVPAELRYWRGDPYAVHVGFDTGEAARITWTFARQLLQDGLRQLSGSGDVHVAPSPGPAAAALLCLGLSSPSGQATFEVGRSEVTQFLRATFDLVPVGAETDELDLDAELTSLLARNS